MNKNELRKIKEKALEDKVPIIMDDTLSVIDNILKENNVKSILEIGTAVGYSAICFTEYLQADGFIDTIERDEMRVIEARENIKKAEVEDKINIYFGDAVEILPTINKKYNVIFIDAAKGKYPFFLKEALRMLDDKGIIFADNVLYKGYVMSDYNKHKQRTAVRNLREFIAEIQENDELDVEMPSHIAGLLLGAVVSDTLLFKSPTCTPVDTKIAKKLAEIAGVDIQEFAMEMFKAGTSLVGKTVDEIFNQDFKKFSFDNLQVGVAQVNSMDIEGFLPYKKDMLDYMNKFAEDNNLEFTLLLLTDIINANSEIFVGGPRPELVEKAFNVQLTECQGTLAGVISRKKQVVPAITAVMSE